MLEEVELRIAAAQIRSLMDEILPGGFMVGSGSYRSAEDRIKDAEKALENINYEKTAVQIAKILLGHQCEALKKIEARVKELLGAV